MGIRVLKRRVVMEGVKRKWKGIGFWREGGFHFSPNYRFPAVWYKKRDKCE